MPEVINEKYVEKYFIEAKNIISEKNEVEEQSNQEIMEESQEQSQEQPSEEIEETKIENNLLVEKAPLDNIFLTEEELKNNEISLKLEYDKKENEKDITLYNKKIEQETNENIITVDGYMPEDAKVEIIEVNQEDIEQKISEYTNNNQQLSVAYDIKIISGDKEYEPNEFDESLKVTISGVNKNNNESQKYKILHINPEDKIEEITQSETNNVNEVSFDANSFSTYAVMLDDSVENIEEITKAPIMRQEEVRNANVNITISQGDRWDGTTVASSFSYGDGTQQTPYLISTCAELAYLASQVNSGNTYENNYFQLTNNMDLNNNEWTPIGTNDASFRGVFDGAGFKIYNATITTSATMPTTKMSYGFFGSIGGGNSVAIIRNVEFSNININITPNGNASNTNGGLHIGIISGKLYKNAKILNCIAKESNITDSNTITIRTNFFQVFVGGLVGLATNSTTSETDPGAVSRYNIENCFSDVDINLDIRLRNNNIQYAGQYAVGGVIGAIRSQPVWPSNCLYTGNINVAYGFVGPIFGYLRNNTTISNNNYNTFWNGNDAGNLTISSYYSSYVTNSTTFTSTYQNGNTPNNNQYRRSTSTNSINYVQGMNKGIYTNDIATRLNSFSDYASVNEYVNWKYENGTFSLIPVMDVTVDDSNQPTYQLRIINNSNMNPSYTFKWYINGVLDESLTGDSITKEPSFETEYNCKALTFDGIHYIINSFTIPKLEIHIEFDINNANSSVIARLEGTALPFINISDYTFQWYNQEISDGSIDSNLIEGANTLSLSSLQSGLDYILIATNNTNPELSVQNSFTFGDRIVVYVKYNGGNNANDGYTPQTPVQNFNTAYQKLMANGTRNNNVIVLMDSYTDTSFMNSETSSTYNKAVTITGKYKDEEYNARLAFQESTSWSWTGYTYSYKYLNGDTTFMNLTFDGDGDQTYFYLQGYNLTMGEGLKMENYAISNTNQGLIEGNSPAFHIFAGWLRYNYSTLPRNNAKIFIRSGTYARMILGGSPGTTGAENLQMNTSHNFIGSSATDEYKPELTVDIKNSTTPNNYAYNINLVVGGAACGNMYANVNINIKNGTIGRVLGASIGDSSDIPNNWRYPINTFIGTTTINMEGGSVVEMYGGSLGRNMLALQNRSSNVCDSYFYGTININISGGEITRTIYGAGAGGVTGYSENSTDPYKSYGENINTTVNINLSGGTINADVYGGGYGYTEYLTTATIPTDGGSLYGTSNINITGSPTINGSIFAGGRGYDLSSRPNLAEMEGTSNVTISDTPTITGNIYGAGMGVSGYENMAKLTGTSNVNINTDLTINVYGGGNISQIQGDTYININSGNHTADIFGGGNIGKLNGASHINIIGGTTTRVFGGSNASDATTTNVILSGGNTTTIFGGSNTSGTVTTSNITTNNGTVGTIYGGNNAGGLTQTTTVNINGGTISTAIYGGGNQANTITSNIIVTQSDNNIPEIYGAGYSANVETTNINCNSTNNISNVFGGSNTNGTLNNSNIILNSGVINNVYGGNNAGGNTISTNIILNNGTITNIYGGGNRATTTNTNVYVRNGTSTNIFGGGNEAGVNQNTNVEITGGTVTNNVYGGGNEGTVSGNTTVRIKDATIQGSSYAGGNGVTAIVYGNATINVDGNAVIGTAESVSPRSGCVFGGGNAAATGDVEDNTSSSTVNIVGGTIYGNVYGGANTSVVYGTTNVNIGYNAVENSNLTQANLYIKGTIFGGGEANASGSEVYDYYFISVTEGINMNIDGTGYSVFKTEGSIFGSGNASSTSGNSNINIKNFGTIDNPQRNISIQRATTVTLDNSAMVLFGAKDRTNEYSNVLFTLSRIDELKLKNNSTLYLDCGANLVKKLSSLVDENGEEVKAVVTIDEETGANTKNVDNRIYMLEGKNLNIATNEKVTAYGDINGMTFLGMFTNQTNPSTSTGFYNHYFNNSDEITNFGTFSSNSYVLGRHYADHDITVDGFYTNYNNEGYIKNGYVGVTPEDDLYYIWSVGEEMNVTSFDFDLVASKYATLGTYELLLTGFSNPNLKFTISGFSSGLNEGISLINYQDIEAIAPSNDLSDSTFGLTMKTGRNGWQTNSSTNFYTANGGSYDGNNIYNCDNSAFTPTLTFCFYHSQNLTLQQNLGTVKIRFQVLSPVDDLNYEISYVDINITLSTALFQDDFYEASISPGEEFGLFTTTETDITENSVFSTYYSLLISDFTENTHFENYTNYDRVLVSRTSDDRPYIYPENTKITMLDMVTNKYYYYVVSAQDVQNNKYIYKVSDFIRMGSTNEYFDNNHAYQSYYNSTQDLLYENYIFHVDFSDANIPATTIDNTFLMELHDENGQTLIGVLGIERDATKYSIHKDKDSTIDVNAQVSSNKVYLGSEFNLNVSTEFIQQLNNSKTIFDTQYFDKQMGIKISIFDNNGNQLSSDSLLGIRYILDGKIYYPRIDGTTRINIAERVSNVLSRIKVDTANNSTLNTGLYKIKIESFGSPDGIYYGLESSDSVEVPITIINGIYGLKVSTDDKSKFIDKQTGNTLNGNNSLVTKIEYSSALENPNIGVVLYRRDYDETYQQTYTKEDLTEYVTNMLTSTGREKEYIASGNPAETITYFLNCKTNLKTGTYKLVFKLYDGQEYIGEAFEYFIVK